MSRPATETKIDWQHLAAGRLDDLDQFARERGVSFCHHEARGIVAVSLFEDARRGLAVATRLRLHGALR